MMNGLRSTQSLMECMRLASQRTYKNLEGVYLEG